MISAIYNGRSLSSKNRLQKFEKKNRKNSTEASYWGLCEVRRKWEKKIYLFSEHVLYYRNTEDVKTNSVGFLIYKRWKTHILQYDSALDRVRSIRKIQDANYLSLCSSKKLYWWRNWDFLWRSNFNTWKRNLPHKIKRLEC